MYKDMISAVTKRVLSGRGRSFSVKLRKYFVSLICDGRLLSRG